MEMRYPVITGIGVATPLGIGLNKNFASIKESLTSFTKYKENDYRGRVDIQQHLEIPSHLSGQFKFLNRGGVLGLISAIEAMSMVDYQSVPPEYRSIFLATGDLTNTGCEFLYQATKNYLKTKVLDIPYDKFNKMALNKVNPFFLLDSIANNPFSFISAYFTVMGDNTTIASLSPCGSLALDLASRSIKQDRALLSLVIGSTSWINDVSVYEMRELGLISRCKRTIYSFAPFDKKRDGFIPSEGSSALVIEQLDRALSRGASILGKIINTFCVCDAANGQGISVPHHMTYRAMKGCIEGAGLHLKDIAFICAHGSGSIKGDNAEMMSIIKLFEDCQQAIPVCALKPYTGHMGAGSDIFDIVMSLYCLKHGFIPKTLNLSEVEERFSYIPFTKAHTPTDKDIFMTVSNGLGGQSVVTLIQVIR